MYLVEFSPFLCFTMLCSCSVVLQKESQKRRSSFLAKGKSRQKNGEDRSGATFLPLFQFILWYMYLISSSCCNICSTFKETINKKVNQNEVTVTVIILNDKIYFLDESNQKYGCNSRNLGKLPNYTYFYLLS